MYAIRLTTSVSLTSTNGEQQEYYVYSYHLSDVMKPPPNPNGEPFGVLFQGSLRFTIVFLSACMPALRNVLQIT